MGSWCFHSSAAARVGRFLSSSFSSARRPSPHREFCLARFTRAENSGNAATASSGDRALGGPALQSCGFSALGTWRTSWSRDALRCFSSGGVIWRAVNEPTRLLVVQPRIHPLPVLKAKLLEALRLADSLEDSRHKDDNPKQGRVLPPYVLVQNPTSKKSGKSSARRLEAGAYFGTGTIDLVRAHVDQAASKGRLDAVFVNAPLSGVQQRNLEDAWGKPVLDRVGLIIEIFGAHAQTKAARLQILTVHNLFDDFLSSRAEKLSSNSLNNSEVELASLYYKRSRLIRARGKGGARLGFGAGGESQVVSARGRATGAIGGAGETEIQLQRRRVGARQHRLTQLLAEVDRTQSLHRAARQRQGLGRTSHGSRFPVVAVVGYTNAGKSSLVAALSQSTLYIDDKLFATLDTRSRRVVLPSGQKVILSDTVGFISDLPIQLVKAFQSTLDEVVEADYLLHVIDSSAPNAREQRETVLQVLEMIGVTKHKLQSCLIEVWNKVDLSGDINIMGFPDEQLNRREEVPASQLLTEGNMLVVDNRNSDSHLTPVLQTGGENVELLCLEWSNSGVSCVATSVHTRTGLQELLRLLDEKLRCVMGAPSEKELNAIEDVQYESTVMQEEMPWPEYDENGIRKL